MNEKTVKIDDSTSRLVDDMAYYLQATKKAIVRDAVAEFAEARRPRGRYSSGGTVRNEPTASTIGNERAVAADGIEEARGPTFEDLPVRERLELRRSELIRAFARREAHEIRVMNPRALVNTDGEPIEDEFAVDGAFEVGHDDDLVELLVTTDVVGGGEEAVRLEEIARDLLRAPIRVESATKLRLSNPARLEQARKDSVPL